MTESNKTAPPAKGATKIDQAPDLEQIRQEIQAEEKKKADARIKRQVKKEVESAEIRIREEIRRQQDHDARAFQANQERADAALAKEFPRYYALAKHLSQDQRSAIEFLESKGFQVFITAKVDEVTEKIGKRRRTFCRAGRYDIVLALPKAEAPKHAPAQGHPSGQKSVFELNQALIDQLEE